MNSDTKAGSHKHTQRKPWNDKESRKKEKKEKDSVDFLGKDSQLTEMLNFGETYLKITTMCWNYCQNIPFTLKL